MSRAPGPEDAGQRAFARIRRRFLGRRGVSEGTGFGSNPGLRVGSKIFAMLGRDGELVVKLPRARVDEIVESGVGERFDPRSDGRVMREWATVPVAHAPRWPGLAEEAYDFVSRLSSRS